MQIWLFLDPTVTCPMCPVASSKSCWSFFLNGSSLVGDDFCSVCWDTGLEDTPNLLLLFVFEWWNTHNWENNKGLTPSRHTKESNPNAPYCSTNAL